MTPPRTHLVGLGTAFPAAVEQRALWEEYFAHRSAAGRAGEAAFAAAGVRRRHAAFDPRDVDVSGWSTGKRMSAYLDAALPLALAAAERALADGALSADDIGLLAVTSCTGHVAPGLDVLLARELGVANDARRLLVGHLGCHAALPTLATADEFVAARGRPALVVAVEISSLHLQPPPDDAAQSVVHALFADGAAACALSPTAGPASFTVLDHASASALDDADAMSWHVGDHGFVMRLSRRVPQLVGPLALRVAGTLLTRNGLATADVAGWAIHPGGPRVVEESARALELPTSATSPSLAVLAERGNCSSATVLIVLDELRRTSPVADGAAIVALAFGPGLTCYGALLRVG